MWGGTFGFIIQLISGAAASYVAAATMKQYNLGTLGNSIAGVIGGGVGAQIIGALAGGAGAEVIGPGRLDIAALVGQIAAGGVGGAFLLVIVAQIKQALGGRAGR